MLPSIRHLLDEESAAGHSDNNHNQNDNIPTSHPSSDIPALSEHYQKIDAHKQTNLIAVEGPHQERNVPQYRQTQHHPHPPYEPLHPPHLHSHSHSLSHSRSHPSQQQRQQQQQQQQQQEQHQDQHQQQEYGREQIPILLATSPFSKPSASQEVLSFKHYSQSNGQSGDYNQHYALNTSHSGTGTSPSEVDAYHSPSPRISPRNSCVESDPRRESRVAGSLATSGWPPRPHSLAQGPTQPQLPQSQSTSSSYRSQQRASPFDPSVSSSSSSASPSPSISSITVASTPLTTDAIAAVTKGTAAASISDSRSRYASGQGASSRAGMRGDPRESGSDRQHMSMDYSERSGRSLNETVPSPSPHGGLVQAASWDSLHFSPPYNRLSHTEPSLIHRQHPHHSPPPYPEEPLAKRSSSRIPLQSTEPHRFQSQHASDPRNLYGADPRTQQESFGNDQDYAKHHTSSDMSLDRQRPESHPAMHFSSSSTPRPHYPPSMDESRAPLSSSSPPSPTQRSMGAAQQAFDRERNAVREWAAEPFRDDHRHQHHRQPQQQHVETLPAQQTLHQGKQGHGCETVSSSSMSGPTGVHTNPSPMNSSSSSTFSSRQQHFAAAAPHSPHPPHSHPSHPTLQQQQHPPPLYDPVRESDHRTFQRPTSQAPTYSYQARHQPGPGTEPSHPPPRQRFATADPMPTSAFEGSLSRQSEAQQHGIAASSGRLTSPGPSHLYYTPVHAPRPFPPQSGELVDARYNRMVEDDPRQARAPMPHGSHPRGPPNNFTPTSSSQARFPDEAGHGHGGHVRHSSHGYAQMDRVSRHNTGSGEGRHGSWSDEGSGHDPRGGVKMRGSEGGTPASLGMQSTSMTFTSHWKKSQRSIRPSVSESDLQKIESENQRRDRHMAIYRDEDLNEDDVEDLEEGEEEEEEEEEEGSEGEFYEEDDHEEPGRRIRGHLSHLDVHGPPPPSHQQPYPCGREAGAEHGRYGAQHARDIMAPSGHRGPPSHALHRHQQAHSYDGSSMQHSQHLHQHQHQHPHDYSPQSHQDHPAHAPQLPQSYPPPLQAHQNPHMPSQQHAHHPGQYQQHPQQQQQQQHPMIGHYPPSSSSSSEHLQHQHGHQHPHHQALHHHPHSPHHQQQQGSHHGTSPKMVNRRGPYLSRQRAIMAGLEVTTPSSRYQCQYCQKRFSRPSSLRIHTYSHTGERPFKCSEEGCGRQFSVQSNMRRHLRVHRLGRMRSEFPPRD